MVLRRVGAAPLGQAGRVLECVVNVSEGRDAGRLEVLGRAAGRALLDVHSDSWHHRSVLTLGGDDDQVVEAVRRVAVAVVELVDIQRHQGAHPRFGAIDVVPWVGLEGWPVTSPGHGPAAARAREARDDFARWAGARLDLPAFVYGPERSLPQLRRTAWSSLAPDHGPGSPHPRAGAVAVGCRPLMVAYNMWLVDNDLARARALAVSLRSPAVRALAFDLGGRAQVSCNLVRPLEMGPAQVADSVKSAAALDHTELVGLVPMAVLQAIPRHRWAELDLGEDRTIEARLSEAQAR